MKRPLIFIFAALIAGSGLFASGSAWAGSSAAGKNHGYFKLNPITDSVLIGSGLALFAAELALINFKDNRKFNDRLYEHESVNKFDGWSMRPYSRSFDTASHVTVGLAAASPIILLAADKSDWLTIYTMYAETMLLAHVTTAVIKSLVFRPRPYVYFDGYPQKGVRSGDWNNSFPSGHTAMAFAAASFTAFVALSSFPNSGWSIAAACTAGALAVSTAAFRMAGGSHFFSDCIVGAVIGTAMGIGVPLLHKTGARRHGRDGGRPFSFSLSPFGFHTCFRF